MLNKLYQVFYKVLFLISVIRDCVSIGQFNINLPIQEKKSDFESFDFYNNDDNFSISIYILI